MKAKNVNLNTLLYIVEADEIKAIRPDKVSKIGTRKIRIGFDNSYRNDVDANLEDEKIQQYFLNFTDARKKQSEIRKRNIAEAYEEMQEAIEKYNKMIEKYFDKPLTSDSEVIILNQ